MKPYYYLLSTLLLSSLAQADETPPSYLLEQPKFEDFKATDIELPTPKKSPFMAVGLSALCPGLGHAYLGDFRSAGGIFASSGALMGLSLWENDLQTTSSITWQNLLTYNIYAAYRDVRVYNQNEGYYYRMPTETLSELALAPLKWSVIKKPEVWGGVLGALVIASAVTYLFANDSVDARIPLSSEETVFPIMAFPIAIGEESFFRGFLQSALYDSLTPVGSIIVSSLAFGAAHIPNALLLDKTDRKQYYTISLPVITTFGAYFGYLTYKNCSLKESVAVHAWYDFILFLGAYSAAQSAAIRKPSVGFSFSF